MIAVYSFKKVRLNGFDDLRRSGGIGDARGLICVKIHITGLARPSYVRNGGMMRSAKKERGAGNAETIGLNYSIGLNNYRSESFAIHFQAVGVMSSK